MTDSNKPFNPYENMPTPSVEEIRAEYMEGQEQKRLRREAGLPEPRFVDYIGLLDGDKHTDMTQTNEQRKQWKALQEKARENFRLKHGYDDESFAIDIEAGYFDVVHGKLRSHGVPSSVPHVVCVSGPHPQMYSYQREALERIQAMTTKPMICFPPRGMGKLGFGGHADAEDLHVEYDFEATVDWPTRFKEMMANSEKMQIKPLAQWDSLPEGFGHRCGKTRTEMARSEYLHEMLRYETVGGGTILDLNLKYKRLHEAGKKHEAICKELLKPHKKRRKALRKQLDIIGLEYK